MAHGPWLTAESPQPESPQPAGMSGCGLRSWELGADGRGPWAVGHQPWAVGCYTTPLSAAPFAALPNAITTSPNTAKRGSLVSPFT